jgi:hypothetical protein
MAKFAQTQLRPVLRPCSGYAGRGAGTPNTRKGAPEDALSKIGADLVTAGLLEKA